MVKSVFSDGKGLVQSAGSGVDIQGGHAYSGTQTIEAPAAAEAVAGSTIKTNVSFVTVTNATNANDRIYLPSPSDVRTGHRIWIHASEAFELCSKGDGTTATTINGTAVTDAAGDFAKELGVTAATVLLCIKNGANAWLVLSMGAHQNALGTPASD